MLGAVTRACAGLDSGKGSHFVGSPRGGESSNHSAPRPLPCAGSRVAGESRGGEPACGRGLCCPVLGGRASARHTGQLSWDVSLQRWDSHPSAGQGRPSPRGAGVPSSELLELPRSQCKLLAAGGWGLGAGSGARLLRVPGPSCSPERASAPALALDFWTKNWS